MHWIELEYWVEMTVLNWIWIEYLRESSVAIKPIELMTLTGKQMNRIQKANEIFICLF